jgi:ribosomal protein S18 acetylase RimI-like enzyme
VLPDYRRQSIGTELSEVALGYGRRLGYERVVGHVPKENEAALSFFSSIAGMANLNPESLRFELPLE